jgi:hypothetical protein
MNKCQEVMKNKSHIKSQEDNIKELITAQNEIA